MCLRSITDVRQKPQLWILIRQRRLLLPLRHHNVRLPLHDVWAYEGTQLDLPVIGRCKGKCVALDICRGSSTFGENV